MGRQVIWTVCFHLQVDAYWIFNPLLENDWRLNIWKQFVGEMMVQIHVNEIHVQLRSSIFRYNLDVSGFRGLSIGTKSTCAISVYHH